MFVGNVLPTGEFRDPHHISLLVSTCEFSLQKVMLALGFGGGHWAERPSQLLLHAQSDTSLHLTSGLADTNLQVLLLQQGPWLGLQQTNNISILYKSSWRSIYL